ncbi:FAR1-related sequence 5-like protein, partial [Tanacetum coccineum]
MMSSQRKIIDVQAIEIDLADDSGIKAKASYELMSHHGGGKYSVGYTLTDQKNYRRKRRQREMKYGEAGTLLSSHGCHQHAFFSFLQDHSVCQEDPVLLRAYCSQSSVLVQFYV